MYHKSPIFIAVSLYEECKSPFKLADFCCLLLYILSMYIVKDTIKECNLSKTKYQRCCHIFWLYVLWVTFGGITEDQMHIIIKKKSKNTRGNQKKKVESKVSQNKKFIPERLARGLIGVYFNRFTLLESIDLPVLQYLCIL